MSLDEEMQNEIRKMEKEMQHIEEELEKLQSRVLHLIGVRNKLEKDASILRAYFMPQERKEKQTTLAGLVK
ncbi:MAG: hypothetical protein QMD85_00085 [Candidatus Aenigmarchaeota archaeon]|nr:hypothetical protein [Candidatus Aenigmarchaeota archaeon]MDI6721927.1 hypothetical protein [Candidatus Aenigmarchaeota archaeon]